MKLKRALSIKCKKIKLVITDVDGVLTDGGMYYSENGEAMKKFNTHDSMGMELLQKNGIQTILITRENSKIVKKRAEKIKVADVFMGVIDKESLLPQICKKFKISNSEIAYIGDDINDYNIMKKVGFAATPNDGLQKIKSKVDYVCKLKGGDGAFREVADFILNAKN